MINLPRSSSLESRVQSFEGFSLFRLNTLKLLTSYTAVQRKLHPDVDDLTTNETYRNEQLSLYFSQRQGAYTIVVQGGNTVALLPLPQFSQNFSHIIDFANAQSPSSIYPSGLDSTVLSGYRKQRSLLLQLYSRNDTAVQETAFNKGFVPIALLKPLSRGTISINTTAHLAPPVVDYRTLSDPTDLETMVAALRLNRQLMTTPAMVPLGPVEQVPGANVSTDAQLREALRAIIGPTFQHPCCTCPMVGRKDGGVLDPELRVEGVRRLSVVDASVMPIIPGGMRTSENTWKSSPLIARSTFKCYGVCCC